MNLPPHPTPASLDQDPLAAATPVGLSPKPKKKDKPKKVGKGVETLFRTTLSNHLKLSDMADKKANLMISINTIVISVILSAYARTTDAHPDLLLPSVLMLVVCLVTIVVSLLATNPTIAPGGKRGSTPADRPVDLLFFGDYTRLSASDYRQQIQTLLRNDDDLYNSLIDNVYAQGKVLSRKYRLLKFAYQFFMIGFPAVVILAIVTLLLTH